MNAVKANKVKTKLNIHVFFPEVLGFCVITIIKNNKIQGTVAEGKLKINLS